MFNRMFNNNEFPNNRAVGQFSTKLSTELNLKEVVRWMRCYPPHMGLKLKFVSPTHLNV